jgi:hypothetical protein
MSCHGDLAGGPADPVLLIAGSGLNPEVNWNYEPAFRARHQG